MAPFGFRGYNARVRNAAALAVALGIVIAPTAAAAPRPHVERARAGVVEVTFSYAYDAAKFGFSRQRLVIRRAGVTRFAAALRRPPSPGGRAQPANYFDHRRSVSVRDLDRDGAPEVVLDLYWGGAHCCWYTQIYRYVSAAGTYRPLVHVWGNPAVPPGGPRPRRDARARRARQPFLVRLLELRGLALADPDPALRRRDAHLRDEVVRAADRP